MVPVAIIGREPASVPVVGQGDGLSFKKSLSIKEKWELDQAVYPMITDKKILSPSLLHAWFVASLLHLIQKKCFHPVQGQLNCLKDPFWGRLSLKVSCLVFRQCGIQVTICMMWEEASLKPYPSLLQFKQDTWNKEINSIHVHALTTDIKWVMLDTTVDASGKILQPMLIFKGAPKRQIVNHKTLIYLDCSYVAC